MYIFCLGNGKPLKSKESFILNEVVGVRASCDPLRTPQFLRPLQVHFVIRRRLIFKGKENIRKNIIIQVFNEN